jgi:hypothetical protein
MLIKKLVMLMVFLMMEVSVFEERLLLIKAKLLGI